MYIVVAVIQIVGVAIKMMENASAIPSLLPTKPRIKSRRDKKLKRAKEKKEEGLAYIHVFSPCPTGWGVATDLGIELCRRAVRTNYFPLWEAERGQFKLNHTVKNPKPISDYIQLIGKFRHLTEEDVANIQETVNRDYAFLSHLTAFGRNPEC